MSGPLFGPLVDCHVEGGVNIRLVFREDADVSLYLYHEMDNACLGDQYMFELKEGEFIFGGYAYMSYSVVHIGTDGEKVK